MSIDMRGFLCIGAQRGAEALQVNNGTRRSFFNREWR